MTPEELNRTIEFIIQGQARLAAAQEQDREDRVTFEKWSKGLFAQMSVDRRRIIELTRHELLAAQKVQKRKRGQ